MLYRVPFCVPVFILAELHLPLVLAFELSDLVLLYLVLVCHGLCELLLQLLELRLCGVQGLRERSLLGEEPCTVLQQSLGSVVGLGSLTLQFNELLRPTTPKPLQP